MTKRIGEVLEPWRDTPFMAGQQVRGGGADCIRFVVAVLAELYHEESKVSVPWMPDVSDRRNWLLASELQHRFPNRPLRGSTVLLEPGDVVMVGTGGPSHVLIVGPRPNSLWHAVQGAAVVETGIGVLDHALRAWRMMEKQNWLQW